jgi:hypothetical protein
MLRNVNSISDTGGRRCQSRSQTETSKMFLSEQLLQSALGPGPKHTSVSEISALVANSTSGEEVGTTVGVIENDMGSFIPQEWQVPLLVLVRRCLLPQCAHVVRMTDWKYRT